MSNILSLILLVTFFVSPINDPCSEFNLEAKRKISELKNISYKLKNPEYFTKNELLSVVLPEYVMYDKFTNYVEKAYTKFTYNLNFDAWHNTSIGPFQMTPNFISNCIVKSDPGIIEDPLFLDVYMNNHKAIVENFEYFTSIKIQWEILSLFERIYISESNGDINYLRNIYHSGDNYSYEFSKINCQKKKYKEWSDYLKSYLD